MSERVRMHSPIRDDVMALVGRSWDRCECGWPESPCKEYWTTLRPYRPLFDTPTATAAVWTIDPTNRRDAHDG